MDPSLNHVTSKSTVVQNYAGLLGAYISGFLSDVFGIAAYVWPIVFGAVGVACIAPRYELLWWRWLGYFLLTLCLLFVGAAWNIQLGEIHGGGMVGNTLFQHAIRFLSPWGSWILWLFLFTMATQLTFGISWANIYKKAHVYCTQRLRALPLLALPQGTPKSAEAGQHQQQQSPQHEAQYGQAPLVMGAEKTAPSTETISQSWLAKFRRFSLKRNTPDISTKAASNAETISPVAGSPAATSSGGAWGFGLQNFFQGIKAKFQQKTPVAPMPEIYDVEAMHIDDPNITIVPPQPYGENPTPPTQTEAPSSEMYRAPSENLVTPAAATTAPHSAPAQNTIAENDLTAPLHLGDEEKPPEKKGKGIFSFRKREHTAPLEPLNIEPSAPTESTATLVTPSTTVATAATASAPISTPATATTPQPSTPAAPTVAPSVPAPVTTSASTTVATPAQAPAPAMAPKVVASNVPIVDTPPSPATAPTPAKRTPPVSRKYAFPSLSLLQKGEPSSPKAHDVQIQRGQALMDCLSHFSIQGELVRITPGPVVTMYEVRPAAGIRVNKISNLTDDIALALKAIAIRIQAPIPGSDTVGIEIPNVDREMVNFREVLESPEFTNAGGPLNMVLGKNIAGHPFVAELSKMPHLLVAGATGAGKSVGLNAILLSLLYTTQPEDMQLLLIDPKRIEMAVYADLPHLVHPVVTEMQHAKTALEWAVHEMDKRYDTMAKIQVRNITGYNQKIQALAKLPPEEVPAEFADMEHMPYLVIIIDELADLMLTAAREVETSIVRLAQLARAAGIHMILATQRPSVDVVTGIIKANFPCRMSFQVTSKHDSRTILDMVGAEHLLGKGDMLYKPSGGRLMRLHGPFVPDEEVQAVVAHWKRQAPPAYKVDFSQWGNEQVDGKGGAFSDMSNDPLYAEVRAFVEEQGKVSISLVQRRFKIGFNKAAVLVEQLEHDGIIGPADGSKPRTIIR